MWLNLAVGQQCIGARLSWDIGMTELLSFHIVSAPFLFHMVFPCDLSSSGTFYTAVQGTHECRSKHFQAFWIFSPELAQQHICSILLVRASHRAISNSRGGDSMEMWYQEAWFIWGHQSNNLLHRNLLIHSNDMQYFHICYEKHL